jgi:hypothetical protein
MAGKTLLRSRMEGTSLDIGFLPHLSCGVIDGVLFKVDVRIERHRQLVFVQLS